MKIHLDRQIELLDLEKPNNPTKKSRKKRLHFAWDKIKFKKKSSFISQNTEEIEILDFEETTKFEKKRKNTIHMPKITIKNKFKFATTCVGTLAILILILSAATGTNVMKVSAKKFLQGLGIYTEEVKIVEIESNDYDNQGSWHIDKSAKWTGSNTAQVTFDVNSIMKTGDHYKDVVLVLDISGSMSGEKMDKAISDSKELVSYLLSNSQNRIAIVTFDSTSTVISAFSNDKNDLLTKLDAITTTGCTNYNAALQNVDIVMNGYTKQSNRDVVTLFLTDGYPNEDTPNQVGTFEVLKDKYPYMTINGVQYEMGSEIIDEIRQITDSQWVADQSTLNNVLFEASVTPIVYEKFIITDYVHDDYFTISSVNDIKVSTGTVTLADDSGTPKITWDLGENSYMTGGNAKMTINLTLKPQYVGSEGFYPTNKRENINYKLPEDTEKNVNSTNTPILKNNYEVLYDTNTPTGCTLSDIASEKHFIYQNVTKKTNELSCEGYLFKGWEIDEDDAKDITIVNDDIFVMPEHDVTIRATWTRQSIVKSMDGTVHEKTTLYKVLQNEAATGTYAKEYTGSHQDSMDASKSTQKIYYYYGSNATNGTAILDKNNVLFAGLCWQMIRTTDTGGVKMIYNGEAVDNQCLSTRGTHVGYASRTSQKLASNYWYGTDYTYDSTAKTFKVSGTTEQTTWNATTGPGLVGKYTCKLTSEDGSCSTLYLVESYYNTTSAYVIPLNSNSNYSQFGTLQFNASYNSPTYVGYMYGDVYSYSTTNGTTSQSFTTTQTMLSSTSLGTSYWYADSIDYGTSTANRYSLVDPYQVRRTDYPNLVGKYTFRSSSQTNTATSVYYIAAVNNTTMYYKQLQSGNLLSAYEPIVFGDSITDNGDGTYTINNPTNVTLSDWYINYATYVNKYTCNDSSTTCAAPRYTTATSSTNYTYMNAGEKIMIGKGRNGTTLTDTILLRKYELVINSSNYSDYKYTCNTDSATCTESTLRMISGYSTTGYNYAPNHYYGSSVTWDGTNYTLVDPIEIENYNNMNNISTHHYMCVEYGTKSCAEVAYVYYYTGSGTMHYITLRDGVTTVDKALEDMLTKNTTNSTMKSGVDAWYKHYLLEDYDDYIEDTIFCNDRSIRALNGWNSDGGMTNTYLQFKEYSDISDLSCTNTTDQFSVSNNNAKLTYKVGLMSSPEMNIMNNSNARKTGQYYWLVSPYYFSNGSSAIGRGVDTNGNMNSSFVNDAVGVRPAVSLTPGIEYSDGDGSMANPYKVELGS